MIAIIIIVIVGTIFLIFNIYHDKIMFINTKLDNIEEKIKSTLIKRKELIKDAESIIKEKIGTTKDVFDDFKDISNNDDIIKLDRKLLIYINEFYLIKDKYEELIKDEEFQKIAFTIAETEDLLSAYKDYYNDNASVYNKLIKSFPMIITTIIKRRKEKLFFDNKSINDKDYQDFKY